MLVHGLFVLIVAKLSSKYGSRSLYCGSVGPESGCPIYACSFLWRCACERWGMIWYFFWLYLSAYSSVRAMFLCTRCLKYRITKYATSSCLTPASKLCPTVFGSFYCCVRLKFCCRVVRDELLYVNLCLCCFLLLQVMSSLFGLRSTGACSDQV